MKSEELSSNPGSATNKLCDLDLITLKNVKSMAFKQQKSQQTTADMEVENYPSVGLTSLNLIF